MNRAERRRQQRAVEKKKNTYTLTQTEIDKIKEEAAKEAIDQALVLLFTIPLNILITDYWPKSAHKRGREFTEKMLDLYHRWENGEVSMDDLKADLWENGGIRFEYKETE